MEPTFENWEKLERKAIRQFPFTCNQRINPETMMSSAGDNATDEGFRPGTDEWAEYAFLSLQYCEAGEDDTSKARNRKWFERRGLVL